MNTRPMALITSTSAPFDALNSPAPRPGAPFGKLIGPEQAVMPLDEDQRLALVPDVIAGGHDVGSGVEELKQDRLGDAEPAGGVLAIDHHEMRAVAFAQARQRLDERRPARSADHVTEKENPHHLPPIRKNCKGRAWARSR